MGQINRSQFLKSLAVSGAGLGVLGNPLPLNGAPTSLENSLNSLGNVPWLDEIQPCDGSAAEAASDLSPLLVDENGREINSLKEWKKQRKIIKERWLNYLGPVEPNPKAPRLKVLKEDYPTGVIRQLVEYEGEPGIKVLGYLIKPQKINGSRPGVLLLHATNDLTIHQPAGVKGNPDRAFSLMLAQLGFVTFTPMNYLWYDRKGRSYEEQAHRFMSRYPNSKGMAKMLFDAARGLDVLEELDEVDSSRLGVMGHSLGAKEVLYLAALDERVSAAVSSEGGIGIEFSNWDDPWYLGEAIHDFGHEQHELLALVAPRPFLLIGGNAADGEQSCPFINAALPVYELYNKHPRLGLLNHEQGHSMPIVARLRSYQWFLTYL